MALEPYKTKSGLVLLPPQKDEDDSFVLIIRGDKDKGYFRGNLAAATAAFKKECEHYRESEA